MVDLYLAAIIFIVTGAVFWLAYREFGSAWTDAGDINPNEGKPFLQRLVAVLWDS